MFMEKNGWPYFKTRNSITRRKRLLMGKIDNVDQTQVYFDSPADSVINAVEDKSVHLRIYGYEYSHADSTCGWHKMFAIYYI